MIDIDLATTENIIDINLETDDLSVDVDIDINSFAIDVNINPSIQGIKGDKGDKGEQGEQGIQGEQGASISLIQIKDISEQTYDILEEDEQFLLNTQYNGNWVANLPNIEEVNDNFIISLIHKQDYNFIGNIISYGDDLIDGESNIKMFGQGLITLRKALFQGSYQWFVSNQVSYNTVEMQGKTRRLDFENQSLIQLQHNLGFIPIVQLWVEDGQGGYVEASVDIDHNWGTMNFLSIDFGSPQTGKLIY
tara:strand:+ start:330 stop:1076 length:747 start_codon:yes stop_codon:yes gene_type:complete